ncbi:hypothetical protein ABXS75_06125 [Roseburia hominis]
MGKEQKICLPAYKIAYSVFFVAVLTVIRGVGSTAEIGAALEPPVAILAAVFCADTYVQEIASKRSEVERLYPMKNRLASLLKRLFIQEVYLLILSLAGYGLFALVQRPIPFYGKADEERDLFLVYIAAIGITLIFWAIFSMTLSCLFRNMWVGIGGSLILWITTNSKFGEALLGKWNLFSYTFGDLDYRGNVSWVCGKIVCVGISVILAAMLPRIIKKRG